MLLGSLNGDVRSRPLPMQSSSACARRCSSAHDAYIGHRVLSKMVRCVDGMLIQQR